MNVTIQIVSSGGPSVTISLEGTSDGGAKIVVDQREIEKRVAAMQAYIHDLEAKAAAAAK